MSQNEIGGRQPICKNVQSGNTDISDKNDIMCYSLCKQ